MTFMLWANNKGGKLKLIYKNYYPTTTDRKK